MSRLTRSKSSKKNAFLHLEQLEGREVPATFSLLTVGQTAAFVDVNGTEILVKVSGGAGKAVFLDATSNVVDDGDEIASVAITGASSDFTLSFAAKNDAGTVRLGNITSDRAIRGIYTVAAQNANEYELGSFIGPGFTANGGLNVDDVVGNVDGVGIRVANLGAAQTINVRDTLDADLIVTGAFDGDVMVGTGTANVDASFRNIGATASINSETGFDGNVTINGNYYGTTMFNGAVTGAWLITGFTATNSGFYANGDWVDLQVNGTFAGEFQVNGNASLDIRGGIGSTAQITTGDDLTLDVTGGVASGANILVDDNAFVTVTGLMSGEWNIGDMSLTANTGISGASISTSSSITATVTGSVLNSELLSGSEATIEISGSVTNSTMYASSDLSVSIGGNVTASNFESGSSNITLDVTGNFTGSHVNSGSSDAVVSIGGNVLNSTFHSNESDVTLTVAGNVTGSDISADSVIELSVGGTIASTAISGSELSVTVGGSLASSSLFGNGNDADVSVGGSITSSRITISDSEVILTVGGSVNSSTIIASGITADITGSITGSRINTDESTTTIDVGGNVTNARIVGDDTDITLNVNGNVSGTTLLTDSTIEVSIGGTLSNSTFRSTGSDVSVDVAGTVSNVRLSSSGSDVTLSAGGSVTGATIVADDIAEINVNGNFSGRVNAETGITVNTTGSASGTFTAVDDLVMNVGSLIKSSLTGATIDLTVLGNVDGATRIRGVDVNNLDIGGNFAGSINATNLNDTGTLVGGGVASSGRMVFTGVFGAGAVQFGTSTANHYLGLLSLGGDLAQDLSFSGNANRVFVGGAVLSNINVGGKLTFLSSNSRYAATDAISGLFFDAADNQTGTLTTVTGTGTVVSV